MTMVTCMLNWPCSDRNWSGVCVKLLSTHLVPLHRVAQLITSITCLLSYASIFGHIFMVGGVSQDVDQHPTGRVYHFPATRIQNGHHNLIHYRKYIRSRPTPPLKAQKGVGFAGLLISCTFLYSRATTRYSNHETTPPKS